MADIKALKEMFSNMSFEEKKKKLITLFETLHDKRPIFENIYDALLNNSRVDEEFMVGVYDEIIDFGEFLEEENKNTIERNLLSKMERLRKKEEDERNQENPDDLLSKI